MTVPAGASRGYWGRPRYAICRWEPRQWEARAASPCVGFPHGCSRVPHVAVLADIHGVLPALEAVLAEPEVRAAGLIVVCGDHAAGPQPTEVLDRLSALGDRCLLVRGNADRELVAMAADPALDVGDPIAAWAATRLQARHLAVLSALPHPLTLELEGFGPVMFMHGSPRDDAEVLLVDTRLERWAEAFAGVPDEVRTIVGGHTHMPFVRLVDGRLVIVPGSVGMPYGRRGAHWALLHEGAVTLRRAAFDVSRAIEQIVAGSGYPDARPWAEQILGAPAGDAEVLAQFGPRDGRATSPTSSPGGVGDSPCWGFPRLVGLPALPHLPLGAPAVEVRQERGFVVNAR